MAPSPEDPARPSDPPSDPPSDQNSDPDTEGENEPAETDTRLDGAAILLVEDDASLGRVLTRLLAAAGCAVTWKEDATSAQSVLGEYTDGFDAAVVDVGLPDESGFNVVYALRGGALPCSAVVMTGDPDRDVVHTSIMAGVSDFLVKPFKQPVLLASIARAIEHTRVWRFRLASHLDRSSLVDWRAFEGYTTPGNEAAAGGAMTGALDLDGTVIRLARRGNLTARERETVELLLRGYRNEEIAAALSISGHTVKYHVRNILRKLSLETRTDLFRLLVE